MKHLIAFALLFVFAATANANPAEKIDSYGIYVADKQGYQKLRPFNHDHFELQHLADLPFAQRQDQALTLYVFQKNFDPQNLSLRAQHVALAGGYDELKFEIRPTDKEDLYRVQVVGKVPNDRVLLAYSGWYMNGSPAIALADPQSQLEALFSDMSQPSHAALPTLEHVVKAYPDSRKLQSLLPMWREQAQAQKDAKDYSYVEKAWQKYEGADKLALQKRYLLALQGEINGYLENHPQGQHAKEAQQRRAHAEKERARLDMLL